MTTEWSKTFFPESFCDSTFASTRSRTRLKASRVGPSPATKTRKTVGTLCWLTEKAPTWAKSTSSWPTTSSTSSWSRERLSCSLTSLRTFLTLSKRALRCSSSSYEKTRTRWTARVTTRLDASTSFLSNEQLAQSFKCRFRHKLSLMEMQTNALLSTFNRSK